jgi:hypothetical protein
VPVGEQTMSGFVCGIDTGAIERPIQAANPLIGDLKRFIDAEVLFHQFCCLACSGLIENDVCRAGYPLL